MKHLYTVAIIYQDRVRFLQSKQVWSPVYVAAATDGEAIEIALSQACAKSPEPPSERQPIGAAVIGFSAG